ncbi:class I SAM-dependent methyltransferase [Maricaulaceae bacterium MS644]
MRAERALKTAHWRATNCDLCGEPRLEILGERSHLVRGRTSNFHMAFKDAACPSCGFVCAAERPDEAFLMAYYRDAHIGHRGGELHFDAQARTAMVVRHVPAGGRVIEIGANDGAFTKLLCEAGFDAFGFDPVEADEAAGVAKGYVADGSGAPAPGEADAVAAYYVVEHVTDPRAWLAELVRLVKPGGVVILEAPNYETHPEDSLNVEHLLHFTPESLTRLARLSGLEPIETGAGTVAYGQSLVARKGGAAEAQTPTSSPPPDRAEGAALLARARAAYDTARDAREARADAARRAANLALESAGEDAAAVFLWGANEYAERAAPMLAQHFARVQVLDKSPSKVGGAFPGLTEPVAHPDAVAGVDGAVFLVCSPNWNAQIAAEIRARPLPARAVIDAVKGERL